jgi:hypothetical protein
MLTNPKPKRSNKLIIFEPPIFVGVHYCVVLMVSKRALFRCICAVSVALHPSCETFVTLERGARQQQQNIIST